MRISDEDIFSFYSAVRSFVMHRIHVKYTLLTAALIFIFIFFYCLLTNDYYLVNDKLRLNNYSLKNINSFDKEFTEISMRNNGEGFESLVSFSRNSYSSSFLDSIAEICDRYNLNSINLVKRHYLKSPDNTSLYCWIRKVASTSLTKLYSDLRNRRIKNDYYKEIDILSPKTIEELKSLINDDKVFKFLLVRHPFERIVSSYRDRIEDNTKYTAQAWIYVPQIFRLTRPHLFYSNESTGDSLSKIFNNDRRLKLVPSFKEFITWLLKTEKSKDDVHWASYYSHCSICNVNYNYIVKLDSNNSFVDMNFILSKIGSNVNKNQFSSLRLEKTRGGLTDYKVTCKYLKTLSRDVVLKLYQRYQIDFEIFNYNYENYVNCNTN